MLPAPVADQLKQVTLLFLLPYFHLSSLSLVLLSNLSLQFSLAKFSCFHCTCIFFIQNVFEVFIFLRNGISFSGKTRWRRELRLRDDLLLRHRRLHCDVGRFDASSSRRLSQRPLHLLRFDDWKFRRLQGKKSWPK